MFINIYQPIESVLNRLKSLKKKVEASAARQERLEEEGLENEHNE